VTTDQVDDVYAYGNQVNYAYYMFRDTWGKEWDALDDSAKLLYMMDWACQQMNSHCTSVYANSVHDANFSRAVAANGGDPEYGARMKMAVTEEGGASSSMVARVMASSRISMRSLDVLEDMAQNKGKGICLTKNSFSAGTRVLMADGTTKPIDRVKVGDVVLATDPRTGKTSAQKVTDRLVNADTELVDLTVRTGGRATTVHTTKEHPFWDPERLKWTGAGDLEPGVVVAGSAATVGAAREFAGRQTMYNLTVANVHTYYVLAADSPILVHNAFGDPAHADECYCNWDDNVILRPAVEAAEDEADDFTKHALQRLDDRGVSKEDAEAVLSKEPFPYYHDGQWKSGYYDPKTKIFVAKTIDGSVNTVMENVGKQYIKNLQSAR
jgi:hypothetical protein